VDQSAKQVIQVVRTCVQRRLHCGRGSLGGQERASHLPHRMRAGGEYDLRTVPGAFDAQLSLGDVFQKTRAQQ